MGLRSRHLVPGLRKSCGLGLGSFSAGFACPRIWIRRLFSFGPFSASSGSLRLMVLFICVGVYICVGICIDMYIGIYMGVYVYAGPARFALYGAFRRALPCFRLEQSIVL